VAALGNGVVAMGWNVKLSSWNRKQFLYWDNIA
jgi:hypothetical protein